MGNTASAFLESARALTALLSPIIDDFAAAAEAEFSVPDLGSDAATAFSKGMFAIRSIRYFDGGAVGDKVGWEHVDSGGFTLLLYEDRPGLEFLAHNGAWEPVTIRTGEPLIIPGLALQYRAQCRMRATCHRVVVNEAMAGAGRISAVCFVGIAHTPAYNRKDFLAALLRGHPG